MCDKRCKCKSCAICLTTICGECFPTSLDECINGGITCCSGYCPTNKIKRFIMCLIGKIPWNMMKYK